MEQLIQTLGVPVIVVLLLLDKILPVLKANKNEKSEKEKDDLPERNEQKIEKAFDIFQRKDNCQEIVKRMDGRFDSVDEGIKDLKRLVKNGGK